METTLTGLAVDPDVRSRRIEPEDFEWIMREHQKRIYRIVFLHLRDSDAADTLTQECFVRAFEKRESFRGESSLGTWLVRIAINLACDHVKNRRYAFWRRLVRKNEESGAETRDLHRSPEQLVLAREEVETVWALADRLPAQQRTAFLLRFAEEMSLDEIATVMELDPGTVKSHLSRALSAVKQRMKRIRSSASGIAKGDYEEK